MIALTVDRLHYLGLLGLLAECAVLVDEETRESIEAALADSAVPLKITRILNRIDVEPANEPR